MPNTVSAKKKTRADARKKVINRRIKGKVKLALKGFAGSPSPENLNKVYSVLDIAVKKRVIPKGRSNRKKSRLASHLKTKKAYVKKKAVSSHAKKVKST